MEEKNALTELNFHLGKLTAQLIAVNEKVDWMCERFAPLEDRFLSIDRKVTDLSIKMALVGIVSGGIGSFIIPVLAKRLLWV